MGKSKNGGLGKHSDDPLKFRIIDGKLIISVGIERIADDYMESGMVVADIRGYANDVIKKLQDDEEDGSTIFTDLLDRIKKELYNDGCEYFEDRTE